MLEKDNRGWEGQKSLKRCKISPIHLLCRSSNTMDLPDIAPHMYTFYMYLYSNFPFLSLPALAPFCSYVQ